MNVRRILFAVGLGLTTAVVGCGPRHTRSPDQLRDAHVAALEADDPAAAYALLSPEVRATVSYEEFAARWKADTAERQAAVEGADELPAEMKAPIDGGTTVHSGGHVLRWTRVGDDLQVADGLPGRPDTSTPAQTVRAFVTAVRRADLAELRVVLQRRDPED